MIFPQHPPQADEATVLTAVDLLAYKRTIGQAPTGKPPETMIFCLQESVLRHATKTQRGQRIVGFFGEAYRLKKQKGRIGVIGQFGLGAPVVAVLLSDLAAWGVRRFILCGIAGRLQSDLPAGATVIVERAIRDEGTSYHYVPPARYALPSGMLTTQLALLADRTGTTWTTDAPYRETAVAVQQYQQEGVLTVEMEAAAFFAVGAVLDVATAVALTTSDLLANAQWQPAPNPRLVQRAQLQLFDGIMQIIG